MAVPAQTSFDAGQENNHLTAEPLNNHFSRSAIARRCRLRCRRRKLTLTGGFNPEGQFTDWLIYRHADPITSGDDLHVTGAGWREMVFKAHFSCRKRIIALRIMSAAGMESPEVMKRFLHSLGTGNRKQSR